MKTTPFKTAPGHWVDQNPQASLDGTPLASWQRDLIAIAEAMFSRTEGPPPPERLEWLARQMADFMAHAGARTRLLLRGSIAAVAGSGAIFSGKFRMFRDLSLAERLHVLEKAERGPVGLATFAVKAMTSILWFEHPDSAREIGFDGGCRTDGQSVEVQS